MSHNSFNHTSDHERVPNDWYVEPRWCVEQLVDEEEFIGEVLEHAAQTAP
jgi:hypothetical protein